MKACLLILFYFLPYCQTITVENNITTLSILYLRFYYSSKNESAFMVEHVEKQMREKKQLHENLRFNITTRFDCTGSEEKYQFEPLETAAQVYYQQGIDAIIGPSCSPGMIMTSQLAVRWNIPVIGYLSVNSKLADKKVFRTLSRVSITTDTLGESTVKLLQHFNWTKVGALVDPSSYISVWIYNAIRRELLKAGIEIRIMANVTIANRTKEMPLAVKQLQENARIIIVQMGYYAQDSTWVMEQLYKANLRSPDYFFILASGPYGFSGVEGLSSETQKAFENAFVVLAEGLDTVSRQNFLNTMDKAGMELEPPNYIVNIGRDYYTVTYDAFYLYMLLVNELFVAGKLQDITNGLEFWKHTQNAYFKGASGDVFLDESADRIPNYLVLSVKDKEVKTAMKVAVVRQCLEKNCPVDGIQRLGKISYTKEVRILWPDVSEHVTIPRDIPVCGYVGELCDKSHYYMGAAASVVSVIALGLLYYAYKKAKQRQLYRMPWHVRKDAVSEFDKQVMSRMGSVLSVDTHHTKQSFMSGRKSFVVSGKPVELTKYKQNRNISFSNNILLTLNQIKSLSHDNLSNFVGLCFNEGTGTENNFVIIWQGYHRGTLEDIIFNEDLNVEESFKFSFVRDILKGLEYLHKSPIGVHGFLDTSNCAVNNHWIVKLSGFGLQSVLQDLSSHNDIVYQPLSAYRLLHMAPEILRASKIGQPMNTSKEGDIYAAGVAMYEIFYQTDLYDYDKSHPDELLDKVINGSNFEPDFPGESNLNAKMMTIVKNCLSLDVYSRPTLKDLRTAINRISPMVGTLVDHMMLMMEKYAGNLEHLVKERTISLRRGTKKGRRLAVPHVAEVMHTVRSVAQQLKAGEVVLPEMFESATVFFCDIVQFTNLCSQSSPMEIVNFLNSLFSKFDAVIDSHDVYKVETIGDAYLVVSGLPKVNGKLHAWHIGQMALKMRDEAATFKIPQAPSRKLQIRCGIHTGPLAAGVIGLTAPRYCIFGDTVNTASRMESSGLAMKIQTTETTKELLDDHLGDFKLIERGLITVKGKGELRTYWVSRANNKEIEDEYL